MSIAILFLAGLGAIAAWWLSQQRLTAKPWLEEGLVGDLPGARAPLPAAKVGLGVLLAVIGSLFALFTSAYSMRMQMADWWAMPVPALLWPNTGALVLSSIALHWAKTSVQDGEMDGTRAGLLAAGVTALAFVIGQLAAWRQLTEAGHYLAGNPADSFFYLITGMHGLQVLGGLVALGRISDRALRGFEPREVRLGVELCAMYWHFLLVVWLFVLSLVAGWAGDFVVICRQLLT